MSPLKGGFYRGLNRELLWGILRGILGFGTIMENKMETTPVNCEKSHGN